MTVIILLQHWNETKNCPSETYICAATTKSARTVRHVKSAAWRTADNQKVCNQHRLQTSSPPLDFWQIDFLKQSKTINILAQHLCRLFVFCSVVGDILMCQVNIINPRSYIHLHITCLHKSSAAKLQARAQLCTHDSKKSTPHGPCLLACVKRTQSFHPRGESGYSYSRVPPVQKSIASPY